MELCWSPQAGVSYDESVCPDPWSERACVISNPLSPTSQPLCAKIGQDMVWWLLIDPVLFESTLEPTKNLTASKIHQWLVITDHLKSTGLGFEFEIQIKISRSWSLLPVPATLFALSNTLRSYSWPRVLTCLAFSRNLGRMRLNQAETDREIGFLIKRRTLSFNLIAV